MAEAALLTPLFIVLIFGVLEFGGAFRDYLTLSTATGVGARQAAIQGNAAGADWQIILAIKAAATAMPEKQITKIVVYHASSASAGMPSGCSTASSTTAGSECNLYTGTNLSGVTPTATMPASWSTCAGPDGSYCPTGRIISAGSGTDYIGIWVESEHPWITGLFGRKITMTQTTITRLEPQKV